MIFLILVILLMLVLVALYFVSDSVSNYIRLEHALHAMDNKCQELSEKNDKALHKKQVKK